MAVGYLILLLGFFKTLATFSLLQAIAFGGLWLIFGVFMLGIPTMVGILRTLPTFGVKELIQGLLAQSLLVAILYGMLTLFGIQSMFSWFLFGGILYGFCLPQSGLNYDRIKRIKENQESQKKEIKSGTALPQHSPDTSSNSKKDQRRITFNKDINL